MTSSFERILREERNRQEEIKDDVLDNNPAFDWIKDAALDTTHEQRVEYDALVARAVGDFKLTEGEEDKEEELKGLGLKQKEMRDQLNMHRLETKTVRDKERKTHELRSLSDVLRAHMTSVVHTFEQMRRLIKDNVKTDEKPEGLLLKPEEAYLACMMDKKAELEVLLTEDKQSWAESLTQEETTSSAYRGLL